MNKKFLVEFLCHHFKKQGLNWVITPISCVNYTTSQNEYLFLQNESGSNTFQKANLGVLKSGYLITFSQQLNDSDYLKFEQEQ